MQIEQWQITNEFTITLRGHRTNVPDSDIEQKRPPKTKLDLIKHGLQDDSNFNPIFDSFYAPTDFYIYSISATLPKHIKNGDKIRAEIRIDGSLVDIFEIREEYEGNMKLYNPETTILVKEDSLIEIIVEVDGEDFEINEHNMNIAISGQISYNQYKNVFGEDDVEWEQNKITDTSLLLRNRSGNDLFQTEHKMDRIRNTRDFWLNGFSLVMFDDSFADYVTDTDECIFVDLRADGKSIFNQLLCPLPIPLSPKTHKEYFFNIEFDESIFIKKGIIFDIFVYLNNKYNKIKGKVINALLYGKCYESAYATPNLSIYELCEFATIDDEWVLSTFIPCIPLPINERIVKRNILEQRG